MPHIEDWKERFNFAQELACALWWNARERWVMWRLSSSDALMADAARLFNYRLMRKYLFKKCYSSHQRNANEL